MEREWLAQQLAIGRSIESIARERSHEPSTVAYWINRFGLCSAQTSPAASRGAIDRSTLEALVHRGLSIRDIAAELEVSVGSVQYWLRKHGLRTQPARYRRRNASVAQTELRECPRHGWTTYRRSARAPSFRCARCSSEAVAARRRRVKAILVAEAGGCCVLCGYGRFAGALQFHHVDPTAKRFQLSFNGVPRAVEHLREEARKCVLLCANCHAEVEGGCVELPSEASCVGGAHGRG